MTLLARAAVVACLVATPALATATFPGVVQTHLSLPTAPQCTVCHFNGMFGAGTVTTPFGTSMRSRGMRSGDEGSVTAALDAMRTAMTDSDTDGVPDVLELEQGTDPNVGVPVSDGGTKLVGTIEFPLLPAPKYGCTTGPSLLSLAALASSLLLMRRRRRR